mmetsp:Transcript_7561/g.14574  ORF Transcript_7561/g.14574 Transcript_7561/m.14574 type:complete len:170 (+) Transcript_7561:110-619(+)
MWQDAFSVFEEKNIRPFVCPWFRLCQWCRRFEGGSNADGSRPAASLDVDTIPGGEGGTRMKKARKRKRVFDLAFVPLSTQCIIGRVCTLQCDCRGEKKQASVLIVRLFVALFDKLGERESVIRTHASSAVTEEAHTHPPGTASSLQANRRSVHLHNIALSSMRNKRTDA